MLPVLLKKLFCCKTFLFQTINRCFMLKFRLLVKNILIVIMCCVFVLLGTNTLAQTLDDNSRKPSSKFDSIVVSSGLLKPTGSTFVFEGKHIELTTYNNTKNSLAGYIPGLYVTQTGGEPGAEWTSMLIRGKRTTANGLNAPYILIDGFEREMNYMDASEIESITVLKDAAATAVYGLKGASGVIEIKTKRGIIGKPQITFNSQLTHKTALRLPQPLAAVDYMTYYNQARVNDGGAADFYAADIISAYSNNPNMYQYPDVDWLASFFNKNSFKQHYNLSIEGGSNIAKYFVNFSYINDIGNLKVDPTINKYSTENKWDKYAIRTNVDVNITDNLTLQAGISAMFGFVNNPGNSNGSTMYANLLRYVPVAHPIINEDNSVAGAQVYTNNPYKTLNFSGYNEVMTRYVTTTTRLQYDLSALTKGLAVYGSFAYDNNYAYTSNRLKQIATYELLIDPVTKLPILDADNNKTYKQWGNNTPLTLSGSSGGYFRRMNAELGFNYNRTFGKHEILSRLFGYNYDYQNDNVLAHAMAGVSGGLNYAYDNRYLLDLAAGWSGTEQFPKENRMFLYPAIGLGWVVSNEKFLKDNTVISYLKLRTSFGYTGSDKITNNGTELYYYYVLSLVKGGNAFFGEGNPNLITSGNFTTGYQEGTIANPTLRPESTEKMNVGVDVAFLKNRLTLTADYFTEYTKYILAISKSMPGMMGIPANKMMLDNIGEVANSGIELQIEWSDKIGSFGYYLGANATFTKNKVIYLDEEPGLAEPMTGYPLDAYWGFVTDGFFQSDAEVLAWADQSSVGKTTPGDLKYINQNPDEDNTINDYDRVFLGTTGMPDWFYGITWGMNYKRWELSGLLQGVTGLNKVYKDGINRPFADNGNIFTQHKDNFWTDTHNENPSFPRLTIDGSSSTKGKSDFWIKDASFLRLKNVELSYTLPTNWIADNSTIRFYLTGANLLSFDKLDGLIDPEVSPNGLAYPINRMFSFGLKLKL